MNKETDKEIYVRYLLGDQPEDERERLEQEYFANPEVLQTLHSAEDDLIDAYVRNMLPDHQRKRFEEYYLDSTERRRRVEFARTLWAALKSREQLSPAGNVGRAEVWSSLLSKATLATALLLALVFLTVLGLQNRRIRSELSQAQSAQVLLQSQIQQLHQESAALQAELAARRAWPIKTDGITISMLLLPDLERGSGFRIHSLNIPSHATSVVLVLDLGQHPGDSYRAVLETAEGDEVRRFENLKSFPLENGNQAIFLEFPAGSLGRGDFVIRVFNRIDQKRVVELHPYSLSVVR